VSVGLDGPAAVNARVVAPHRSIPLADGLLPYLDAAIEASASDYVFPGPDGEMMPEDTKVEIVLRRALGRAGIVIWYRHTCRRCKARGTESIEAVWDPPPPPKRVASSGRRGIGALLILSGVVVVPILITISLARLWRAPTGRKWHWALFILIGVGKLMVNWSSGQIQVKILSIQVLGGSLLRSPAGDWIFAVSLPPGAIIYLLIPTKEHAPVPFGRNRPLNR
jgi:hypothetical protein